jgi:hypothetical protein
VNIGPRRALGCSPAERITADKTAMLSLPSVAPQTGRRAQTQLPRDHYPRVDANDYSVHPAAIWRRIEVNAGAGVRAVCDGHAFPDHQRCWACHQSISDPAQLVAARAMRRDWVTVLAPHGGTGGVGAAAGRLRRCIRHGRGRGLMAAKAAVRDTATEIAFLTRALKAPTSRPLIILGLVLTPWMPRRGHPPRQDLWPRRIRSSQPPILLG